MLAELEGKNPEAIERLPKLFVSKGGKARKVYVWNKEKTHWRNAAKPKVLDICPTGF